MWALPAPEAVLPAAYDGPATGPLETMSPSRGLLGAALVLSHGQGALRLRATLVDGQAPEGAGPLSRHTAGNAMAPMLPLLEALAGAGDVVLLHAGPGRVPWVGNSHG